MLSFEIFVDLFFGDAGQPADSFCSENRIWPFMPRFEAIFVFTASITTKLYCQREQYISRPVGRDEA